MAGYQLTLLTAENRYLRKANEALSKRRRAERTRLQDSGPLTGEKASQLLVEKGVVKQEGRNEGIEEGSSKQHKIGTRLGGICRKPRHNIRTCPETADVDSLSNSNLILKLSFLVEL